MTYEMAPEKFRDGEANISESGNGIPDIVDEARWRRLYARLQRPDAASSAGTFADKWPRPGETSTTDSMNYYVYAEDPLATYKFAANASRLAWCLRLAKSQNRARGMWKAHAAPGMGTKQHQPEDEPKVRDERFHARRRCISDGARRSISRRFGRISLIEKPTLPCPLGQTRSALGVWTYVTSATRRLDSDLKAR
jgi:hypothetical protein